MLLNDNGTITEIPLLVHVLPAVVEANITPTLVIDFHPSGFPVGRSVSFSVDKFSDRLDGAVFVNPRADTSAAPSWAQTETFNRNLVNQLWDELSESLCFRPDGAVWGGVVEGAALVVEAICETGFPMSGAHLSLGMHVREGCEPSRPVPIFGAVTFTPMEGGGPNWDEPWVPPNEWEAKTGTYHAAPDSLDLWAKLYNCTDSRLEQTAADPEELIERDSVVYSYTDCDAPLTLTGFEIDEARFAINWEAVSLPSFIELQEARLQVVADYLEAQGR